MDRDDVCNTIEKNLFNLTDELRAEREKWDRVNQELERLKREHQAAFRDSINPMGGPGRQPKRRERVGIALDIIGAIGQVLTDDRRDRVRDLEARIDIKQREQKEVERVIRNKLQVVKESQNKFIELACYDLGYSHEVLNIH